MTDELSGTWDGTVIVLGMTVAWCGILLTGCRTEPAGQSIGRSSFQVLGLLETGLPFAAVEKEAELSNERIDYIPLRAKRPLANPVYPKTALAAGAGPRTIHAIVTVDHNGHITDVTPDWRRIAVHDALSDEFFAAIKTAVLTWELEPARQVYWIRRPGREDEYVRTEAVAEIVEVKFAFESLGGRR